MRHLSVAIRQLRVERLVLFCKLWIVITSHVNYLVSLFVHRSDKGQPAYSRQNSLFDSRSSQNLEDSVKMSPYNTRRNRSVGSHNVSSSQSPMNAWSHLKENNSDAESTTSRSPPGSPSGSPTASRKQGDIPRAQSLELISSDDGDKGESKRNGKRFDSLASILLQPFLFLRGNSFVYNNWIINSLRLWRWLLHKLWKRQSLSTTVLFRTTFTHNLHTTLIKTSWDTEETRHKDALC